METTAQRLPKIPWLEALLARLVEPADTETGWRFLSAIRWLVLLDIAMLAAVVYDAPYFQVSRVLVSGIDVAEVREFIPASELRGQNALVVDTERIAHDVERAPAVKRATVERRFPNEIAITVEERRPVAIWSSPEGPFQVDDEGVIVRAGRVDGLPELFASGGTALRPGSRVDAGAVVMASKLAPILSSIGEWRPVRYEVTSPGAVTVTTDQGWKVTFGQSDDIDYKLELLQGILQAAKERGETVELVDLRSDIRPHYRPVGASTSIEAEPTAIPSERS